jgi:predicted DNA-binding transcriptional regulator AlpA
MSSSHFYRLRQLASIKDRPGLLPVGPATIWRWVRSGKFPAPFTIGERCTVWDGRAVDDYLKSCARAEDSERLMSTGHAGGEGAEKPVQPKRQSVVALRKEMAQ